ncbi:MAG: sensor domain-containing diguanylate cyclase [Alphaproteobacteria bacterium]|nr:sensor domain-containing diguanylate cyclase [Alphaproteobacteria bacterium]MBU0795796.1 sensor domain-containing diguanylate cyclase [Alphaproteobacteria bacterium]MBU0886658.1 sensor domain-containing diguanylate cyclase [Alphaproteobacteria bacterium]MBU1814513.1 sensor domain-containing diguanylate cyclase [Alphaproteobacteria bacterium]
MAIRHRRRQLIATMRKNELTLRNARRLAVLRRRDAAVIAGLRAQIAEQAALIQDQGTLLAHSRKIFERSSAAARIGVWECNLAGEHLTWTDMVYDIFELPRGSALDRGRTLEFYTPGSLEELHERRSKAIEEGTGFTLDAQIITAKGNRRWMRITATVESENGVAVRIFGMKQDITEEKILADRTRYLAEFDVLTGLANRTQFQARLLETKRRHVETGQPCALLLVDLDGFKKVNDTFGHAAGDECLKQVARRLKNVCGQADIVARIGGDEFAILSSAHHMEDVAARLAGDIIGVVSAPLDQFGAALKLGASVGISLFDASTPSELLRRADMALYAAKAAGRNTFEVFRADLNTRLKNPRSVAVA